MIALLVAMSGTAVAVSKNSVGSKQLKKNSVRSKHVKKNQIKSSDLKDGAAVQGADIVDGSVGRADLGPDAIDGQNVVDGSLTGADIDVSTLGIDEDAETLDGLDSTDFLGSAEDAGGDLSGPFANLQLAGDAVGGAEVADGSLGRDDLAVAAGSTNISLASLAANDCQDLTIGSFIAPSLDAAEVGDLALLFVEAGDLPDDVVLEGTQRVATADQIDYRICNVTDSAVAVPNSQISFLVLG